MVVNRLAVNAEPPKDLLQPNQETLQAISDLENNVEVSQIVLLGLYLFKPKGLQGEITALQILERLKMHRRFQ